MAIEKALRWIVLGGVFLLPFTVLIVAQSLFFPYITGKNLAFRVIVEIIAGAWLALALTNAAYRPRRSWILAAFGAFVAVMALADAFGAYPFKSFWSNFERMDGWVTLIHLYLYMVVAVSVLTAEKLWRRLWQLSLAISGMVGIYSLLQLAGAAALGQGGASGLSARLDATFGNPIYLAVYMLFHIFIALLLWSQERGEAGRRWTPAAVFYAAVIVLDTLVLFFTGTRGTMLGLLGGAAIAGLLYAGSAGSARIWKWIVVSFAVVTLLAAILWAARDTPFVKSVGFLDRLASISISDATVKARFLNWGMAWEGVKERPFLGWGQENYALVFDKYYDPRMYAQEQWFDRVHNSVFDWMVAGGVLGLLAYLSIFAAAILALWKSTFRPEERALLAGLFAAYFFHNLFVFDNLASYLLFATTLSYVAWRASSSERPLFGGTILPAASLPLVAIVCALVVWGAAWWVNARPLAQNRALLQAIASQQEGLGKNLELFEKAISYGTYGSQEAREQLAQGAAQLAGAEGVPAEMKQRFFEAAARELALQADASPLDARFPLFLGVLLNAYGQYEEAASALQRALSLSPAKQSIMYEIAANQYARGRMSEALDTYKRAFELEPSNRDARIFYAAAAIRMGQLPLADDLLAPIRDSGGAADTRIAAAYVSQNRYDKIAEVWEAKVAAEPKDPQGYFTLAAAYYGAGQNARAIEVLEALRAAVPGAGSQADAFIADIRAGTVRLE